MIMSIVKHKNNKPIAQFIYPMDSYLEKSFIEQLDMRKTVDFKIETKSVSSFESAVIEDTRADAVSVVSVESEVRS
jgi:hypothetical protein